MTATAPPQSRSAVPSETAPHDNSRTNENLTKGSTSKAGRKFTLWIRTPVKRGQHLNDYLFNRALHCAHAGATPDSTAKMLHRLVADQPLRPGEIKRQVQRAFKMVRGTNGKVGDYQSSAKWPLPDADAVVKFVELAPRTVADMIAASPAAPPDHPLDVLRQLHGAKDHELLCLGLTPTGGFSTLTFAQWEERRTEIPQRQMVVPNLMRAPHAVNFEGNLTQRCRNNSCGEGGQRFVVLEMDIDPDDDAAVRLGMAPPDICATLILRAVNLQKLRMVVHSGSKSCHAWIDVAGLPQSDINGFFHTWCRFYGDKAGRLPEQQFRNPQAYRADKKARQTVLWWNPEGTR